jgi:hypothetical protein
MLTAAFKTPNYLSDEESWEITPLLTLAKNCKITDCE